jgi:hypothetical protein
VAERIGAFAAGAMYAYAIVGVLFAILFVLRGVQRVDHQARGASIGFRLLILPGAAAFWPLLLMRWLRATGEPPKEGNPHR